MRKSIVIGVILFLILALGYITYVKADFDGDGLSNELESRYGTDPNNPDTDNDGLSDGDEVNIYKTSPVDYDTDNDGLGDGKEIELKTNPLDIDSDDDGLKDGEEVESYHTNPLKPDTDGDGIIDREEIFIYATNPLAIDTDGDGLSDGDEIKAYETDPLKKDADGDGLSDGEEIKIGTNPIDADTDDDGYVDGKDHYPLYDAHLCVDIKYWEEKDYADPLWGHGDVYFVVNIYDLHGRLIDRVQSEVHDNVKKAIDITSLIINIPDDTRYIRIVIEAWDSDWTDGDDQYDISEELESKVLIIRYDILSGYLEVKSDGDVDGSTADIDLSLIHI